jgi:hypothetical protein
MAGYRNWKLIGGATTAAVLVIAMLGFAVFNTNVEAQSARPSSNINPNRPIFPTYCPPDLVQHWDKIVFSFSGDPIIRPGEPNVSQLFPQREYDIKVIDLPNEVADLQNQITRKLVSLNYTVPTGTLFKIVDVEYAIVCTIP